MLISIIIISHTWSNCMYVYAFALFRFFFFLLLLLLLLLLRLLLRYKPTKILFFFTFIFTCLCIRSLSFVVLFLQVKLTQRTSTRLVHSILFPSRHYALERKRKNRRRGPASLVITTSCQNENGETNKHYNCDFFLTLRVENYTYIHSYRLECQERVGLSLLNNSRKSSHF